MRKKWKKLLCILLLSFVVIHTTPILNPVISVEAHSGRTDSNGGHRDKKNASGLGSYHYHHGYSAHLHPGGKCPFESGSATQTKSSSAAPATTKPASPASAAQKNDTALSIKYQNITTDFQNKIATGYFQEDILTVMNQFMTADPSGSYLNSVLSAQEITDLIPTNTSVKSDILAKTVFVKLYEILKNQAAAPNAAISPEASTPNITQPAAPTQQTSPTEDDFLYRLVSQTQEKLSAMGFYTGAINGIFNPETQQALIAFQQTYNLTPDGVINEQAIAVLGISL